MKYIITCVLIGLSVYASGAEAWGKRNMHERGLFRKTHPCPGTGKTTGACQGYVVDHVTPLCAGGPDKASNMQWQTFVDSEAKDVLERRQCARLHKKH